MAAGTMTRILLAAIAPALVLTIAHARSADGTLGVVLFPNNGQPAVVVRGESFLVEAREACGLFLDTGAALVELDAAWAGEGSIVRSNPRVPEDFVPGLYNLVSALNDREEVEQRAVLVLDEAPAVYTIAHVANPAIAADTRGGIGDVIPDGAALLAVVSGDLTATGSAEDFKAFLAWLNTASFPTIVAPGPVDSTTRVLDRYFGTGPRMISCGRDSFLVVGEQHPWLDDAFGEAGAYQRLRRAMKPARWSFGVSGYAPSAIGLRVQTVLFIDTPLDAWMSSNPHGTNAPDSAAWDSFQGATPLIVPPRMGAGHVQWLQVNAAGIAPVEAGGE
jgi:hypothetical protein